MESCIILIFAHVQKQVTCVIYSRCDCMMSKEKENVDPGNPAPSKRLKLSLSRKGKGRFASVSQDDLTSMSKPQIPENTEKSSKWALTNLTDWFEDYNARNPDNPCPGETLTCECSKEAPLILIRLKAITFNQTTQNSVD